MEFIITATAVGFTAGWTLRGRRDADDRDAIETFLDAEREALQERYETTQMDYVEFEDRLGVLEEPGTERIMRDAVQVDGIGPETALEIARGFQGDYDRYRNADRAQLERVNGVGENRAEALLYH